MKRLVIALVLLLATAGGASAHGRVHVGISLGWPLYFTTPYPVYGYPLSYGYYYPPERVYVREPYGTRKVIERVYVNGKLVEKRVKVYESLYGDMETDRDEVVDK
jgi:hypothetical protein